MTLTRLTKKIYSGIFKYPKRRRDTIISKTQLLMSAGTEEIEISAYTQMMQIGRMSVNLYIWKLVDLG